MAIAYQQTLLLALSIAGVVAMLVGDAAGRRWFEWAGKPIASFSFLLLGLATAQATTTPVVQAFLVALAFSVVGDLALMGRSPATFLLGLGAFLLGHVAFVVAFALRGLAFSSLLAWLPAALLLAFLVWRWLGPHVAPNLRPAVLAYMAVISTMVLCSFATHAHRPAPVLVGAAIAFFLSDLAVAREKFVNPTIWNRRWGLPLYFGAQLLFATHLLD